MKPSRPPVRSPRLSSAYEQESLWRYLWRIVSVRKHRTSVMGETVTAFEYDEIRRQGRCPDCGEIYRIGPAGGISMNIACVGCGNEFNVTPAMSRAERTSTPGQPDRDRLQQIFGIELK